MADRRCKVCGGTIDPERHNAQTCGEDGCLKRAARRNHRETRARQGGRRKFDSSRGRLVEGRRVYSGYLLDVPMISDDDAEACIYADELPPAEEAELTDRLYAVARSIREVKGAETLKLT